MSAADGRPSREARFRLKFNVGHGRALPQPTRDGSIIVFFTMERTTRAREQGSLCCPLTARPLAAGTDGDPIPLIRWLLTARSLTHAKHSPEWRCCNQARPPWFHRCRIPKNERKDQESDSNHIMIPQTPLITLHRVR
jgi:hypothetical protein